LKNEKEGMIGLNQNGINISSSQHLKRNSIRAVDRNSRTSLTA
jgi:hypothetical protein